MPYRDEDPIVEFTHPDNAPIAEDDIGVLAAPFFPAPSLRVDTVILEAWVSTPTLHVDTALIEAWVIPGNVNLRVSSSVLEAWVTGGGALRVGTVILEAWVPAPLAIYSLSLGPLQPPRVNFGSSRVTRTVSPQIAAPQLAVGQAARPIFPTVLGQTFPITKELIYGAVTQPVASGKTFSVLEYTDPVWRYTLVYEFLRSDPVFLEQQTVMGMFLQALGQAGTFLYDDPDDDAATNVIFGDAIYTVSGPAQTQTVYQLVRNFYDNAGNVVASAPVYAINIIGSIRVGCNADGSGGTPTSAYTIGAAGRIIFNTPPGISGPPGSHNFLAWSGTFYQLCRFDVDTIDLEQLWDQMFELKQLTFKTTKPTGG